MQTEYQRDRQTAGQREIETEVYREKEKDGAKGQRERERLSKGTERERHKCRPKYIERKRHRDT